MTLFVRIAVVIVEQVQLNKCMMCSEASAKGGGDGGGGDVDDDDGDGGGGD